LKSWNRRCVSRALEYPQQTSRAGQTWIKADQHAAAGCGDGALENTGDTLDDVAKPISQPRVATKGIVADADSSVAGRHDMPGGECRAKPPDSSSADRGNETVRDRTVGKRRRAGENPAADGRSQALEEFRKPGTDRLVMNIGPSLAVVDFHARDFFKGENPLEKSDAKVVNAISEELFVAQPHYAIGPGNSDARR
jgi:hypothetical protein